MLWMPENVIFHIFANFWVRNLKPLSIKARKSIQNSLNSKFAIANILINASSKMVFNLPRYSKQIVWAFESGTFHLFGAFAP